MPSPTLTRHALIAGAGTVIASAALAVPYLNAVRADEVCSLRVDDPLLDAIADYRRGLANFEALTGVSDQERDAFADISYAPPMAILDEWDRPAATLEGAIEALRMAVDENRDSKGSDMVTSMLYAALAYFDPATA